MSPRPMAPGEHFAPARVRRMTDVARDVRLIEIVPSVGAHTYPSGSHIDVAVTIDGLPSTRSYSLVGERPVDGAYRIAVKQVASSRGGSRLIRSLEPGAEILVSEPASHFELGFGCREYLLVAGGIGITPMVGMAQVLARQGAPFRLLYAVRSRAQLAFGDELVELLGDRLEVFVSDEGARLDVDGEIEQLDLDGELYVCGPPRLRAACSQVWAHHGRRPDRLRYETFASGGRVPAKEFLVRVRDWDDREVVVPRNRTLLDALSEQGIDLIWDCRRGECGLCSVRVLEHEGELDHRDVFLSEEEQAEGRSLLACVSRAVGGVLTIDTGFRQVRT